MKNYHPRPNLADVAREAGVGKATVSRVLNGAHKVSPETLARVNRVIRRLNYQPSPAAQGLKGERTRTIGLIVPSLADPFFACCAEAVQAAARARDRLVIVAATDYDPQVEIGQIHTFVRYRVDGILLAPVNSRSSRLTAVVRDVHVPVVTFNHPLPRASVGSVLVDNSGGAKLAAEHLISHGRRRILCLGGDSRLYSIQERQKGYREALQSAGLTERVAGEANDFVATNNVIRAKCVGRTPVDAIFAVRNSITIYAFQALQALGLRIGEDVALVGFDDFELASAVRPAVSVVRQPVAEMGRIASNLLLDQLDTPQKAAHEDFLEPIRLNATLVPRASCGCHPTESL